MELDQVLKNTEKKRAKIKKKTVSAPLGAAMEERPYRNDIPASEPMRVGTGSGNASTRAIVTGLLVRLALDACELAKEKTQEKFATLRKRIRI